MRGVPLKWQMTGWRKELRWWIQRNKEWYCNGTGVIWMKEWYEEKDERDWKDIGIIIVIDWVILIDVVGLDI